MSFDVDLLAQTVRKLVKDFYGGNIKFVVTDNGDGKKTIEVVANDVKR